MRIKLSEDKLKTFIEINTIRKELLVLMNGVSVMVDEAWATLKKEFPDYNFGGASIDHKTNELVLPFEKDVE